jgi:RNA polymerase sigma-70 factor, ECF subfamily
VWSGSMDVSVTLAPGVGVASDAGFDEFYRREWPALVRVGVALTGSRAVAEELAQEAMLRVLTRWKRVSEYDKPGAFARRVLLNLATSSLRRRRVEARALRRRGADDEVAWSSSTAEFWAVVRELPARQANMVVLYYGDDRSTADIAEILGVAEGTVRSTLAQARAALRVHYESEAR